MGNPNKLGNGNSGDSTLINDWKDIGDLIDFAPANNNVEPSKSSKIDIVDDVDDDFEEVDLDGATKNTLGQEPVIVVGQDDLNSDRVSNSFLSSVDGALARYQDDRINKANNAGDKDDAKIDIVDDNDDLDGAPVVGQPNKISDSKDTAKDDVGNNVDDDIDDSPERTGTIGNKVRNIMDRFKKTGIGKLFVKGCLVAALVGAIGVAHHNGYNSGAANATAKMEAKINEMEAKINSINESQLGSDAATKELDRTATTSNAEVDTEKTDKSVDVVTADGRVIESVNFELGGDNSGADMIDRSLMESSHFGALTTKPAEWLNGGEGAEFRAAEGNADAMDSLLKKSIEEFNGHAGDVAVLVQEAYSLGYVDKAQMSLEQKGADTMAIMKDNAKYNDMKSFVEQKKIDLEKNMGHGLMLLTDGQHYASPYIRAVDAQGNLAKSVSEIQSVSHHVDKSVNPYEGGVLVITDVVQGTNLNYYEANPEAKEMALRSMGLIAPDSSESQIKEAMKKYMVLGHEAGCKQLCAVEVTPKDTSTYKVEYKTPEKSSSTSDREKVIIDEVKPNPDENPSPENNTTVTTENKITTGTRHIYRSTHGSHNHDRITPQGKEDEKPRDNETPKDKPGENPGETPKDTPGENPKDNEKVLEAKTADVKGADEFDTQKANTVTDQTVEATLGSEQENARMEVSGAEVGNKTVEEKEVVEEFSKKDESGIENTDKTLDQVENNESLNTGTSEKQSDAEAKMTVEEAKESTEKAPDTSYDLDYASAEWDFSNFGN
ncbi:hypothetical protein [Candidatus Nanosyncoccus nanoralicus]|uniref:Uncharacterized protein n=1 Tax=Candidatus Nanosyncoccus nanoralicus TaxID=2171996 RepID=A0ABY0FM32_9BACT|nr:hypothetical protein [Candidatus Nanosyncoccus nanoralicus]RYC73657.1 hypothetical protein G3KMM_00296 [Candidatus Nanosyncoccus nanoralicus]